MRHPLPRSFRGSVYMATFKRSVVPFANGILNLFRDRTLLRSEHYSAKRSSGVQVLILVQAG